MSGTRVGNKLFLISNTHASECLLHRILSEALNLMNLRSLIHFASLCSAAYEITNLSKTSAVLKLLAEVSRADEEVKRRL